jgi:ribosomal protein S20
MAPAIAAALISAAPAALKGIQGIFQGAKGAKLAKKNIIHANKASNLKSKLTRLVAKL